MDIQKLVQEAQQQLMVWSQKEGQAHDQAQWWRGRLETLQQFAAETEKPADGQPTANEAAVTQGGNDGINQ